MELTKNCPVQRLVHEYQAMIPIGVPANGLVAANQQQGMRMEFRGIVQNHHEFIFSESALGATCKFCLQTALKPDWIIVLSGETDDAEAYNP